ncbi:MAG: hypothetical protein ACJ77Z_12190 [Thermoleophilaceae bacterium]
MNVGAIRMHTVCYWFAESPVIPRHRALERLAETAAIFRGFLDGTETQLLIAMQKAVGSSPISRSQKVLQIA